MATVKISELPEITALNANTSNTVIVGLDIPTTTTGRITATTLARGLYSNNTLAVGNNYTVLPNVVGQFTGNSVSYIQVNLQNLTGEGSGDMVVTADDGDDDDHFIDMGINGSLYDDAGYSSMNAHDGYLYISSSGTGKGNLVIGTTNEDGEIRFIVGGTESGNVIGTVDAEGLKFDNINAQITANAASANSVINTRVSANVATLRSEITANATSLRSQIASNTQSVFYTANAAFEKANNAFANTTGTFGGTLSIAGALNVNGVVTLANSQFSADQAAFTILGDSSPVTPSNDGYMLHVTGKTDVPTRVVFDAFGANTYALLAGRSGRGTAASPEATANGDVLMRIAGNSHDGTNFAQFGVGRIDLVATEDHTPSARGSAMEIWSTAIGETTMSKAASINGSDVVFSGTVVAQKGYIYVPRFTVGAQTNIQVDITNDTLIKANLDSSCQVTLSNFKAGAAVELWLTNTSGSSRTITHGVSALNSTINSTSFSMPATSSVHLKYYSLRTDLANTFVKITKT
jgi:hypothetical protein